MAVDPPDALSVTAVIPALNEAENIGWVLERLPECVTETIVVDGRSTDDTIGVALAARPDVRIVLETVPGKGAALRAGFAEAGGDVIVMLDADGSMEPSEIVRYVSLIEAGNELVKGSRFLRGGGTTDLGRLRNLGNLALLGVANVLYGCAFTDLCYGFMAFRSRLVGGLCLDANGFEIEAQIVTHALRANVPIAEVPSFEAARRSGISHLRTFRDGSRVLRQVLAARTHRWPPETGEMGMEPMVPAEPMVAAERVTQLRASSVPPR
jgi:glycosyltransferase involved in cell wall biosynthesis